MATEASLVLHWQTSRLRTIFYLCWHNVMWRCSRQLQRLSRLNDNNMHCFRVQHQKDNLSAYVKPLTRSVEHRNFQLYGRDLNFWNNAFHQHSDKRKQIVFASLFLPIPSAIVMRPMKIIQQSDVSLQPVQSPNNVPAAVTQFVRLSTEIRFAPFHLWYCRFDGRLHRIHCDTSAIRSDTFPARL